METEKKYRNDRFPFYAGFTVLKRKTLSTWTSWNFKITLNPYNTQAHSAVFSVFPTFQFRAFAMLLLLIIGNSTFGGSLSSVAWPSDQVLCRNRLSNPKFWKRGSKNTCALTHKGTRPYTHTITGMCIENTVIWQALFPGAN